MLLAWNEVSNDPPLPDSEVVSIFRGIAQKQKSQNDAGTTYAQMNVEVRQSLRKLLTVSTILDMPESERPEFLVYGLIPQQGITAMSGHPGSGKSWIMLELAKAVATGEPFLDQMRTKQGNVLIVDEESGVWEMRRRMELLSYSGELPIYFYCQESFKVDDEHDMEALLKIVVDQKILLVIFDPFVAIHSQDENSADGAQKIMESLQKFNAVGATVLFIHHHKKGGGASGQSLRGSSAFSGRLDSHITVEKEEGSHAVQYINLEHVKSRRGQNVPKFRVTLTQGEGVNDPITLLYETVSERDSSKKEQAMELILQILLGNDLFKADIKEAVMGKVDIGSRNIEEALSQLVHQKKISFIKEDSKNKYHLEWLPEVLEGEKPF
jgi:predicted ATP-dependent serine protease